MTDHIKIAITGAAGQIGYALLFRLASGEVFKNKKIDLHLIEIPPALPALRGVLMELEDCAFPLLNNVVITDEVEQGMKDVNWVVLVGAVPRSKGMERSDLLQINGGIFTKQGRAINNQAAEDVKVLVVGNPCNTNCLIAMNNAPDIPNDHFFAMTRLDQNRAVSQLAIKADVKVTDINDAIIWGNHSSTQYPDFYHAKIKNKNAAEVIDEEWLKNQFIPIVQKRGAAVIDARGASSAASAANAIIDSLKSIAEDTETSYSMCVASQGQYGVDEGLIYSFPCKTRESKVEVIEGIEHNAFGQEKLKLTLEELRQERDAVKALKLI